MFSTDFIFRHQENLADNEKCQAAMQQNAISSLESKKFSSPKEQKKNHKMTHLLDK